jgi:hypothetical protein
VLVEILSSIMDGTVPKALIQTVYVCLALVLVVGMGGLMVTEAPIWYFVGLILIVVGFFVSFSWYSILFLHYVLSVVYACACACACTCACACACACAQDCV